VIKLQDRLYYVLQPSLESLVSSNELEFPFEPFPYQFQGIAFLYPRYSAILADEMGLGKTMQAISTIRLLLYSGEVRNVLLICPKPLVSNWRREFALWAPEIPVAIIEGDRAKRQWQWTELDVAVRIANYELLMRDRDLVTDPQAISIWSCLDEAQRIKNRSEHDQPGGPRDPAHPELGPDRHADRKQPRRPGGHLRFPVAGLPCPRA
jgi:SNF2 family DNA or RNA helicase